MVKRQSVQENKVLIEQTYCGELKMTFVFAIHIPTISTMFQLYGKTLENLI